MPDDVNRLEQIKARCELLELVVSGSDLQTATIRCLVVDDLPWCLAQIERLQRERHQLRGAVQRLCRLLELSGTGKLTKTPAYEQGIAALKGVPDGD